MSTDIVKKRGEPKSLEKCESDPIAVYLGLSVVLSRMGLLGVPETQLYANGYEYVASYVEVKSGDIVRISKLKGGTATVMHQVEIERYQIRLNQVQARIDAIQADLDHGKRGLQENLMMSKEPSLTDAQRKAYLQASVGAQAQFGERRAELEGYNAQAIELKVRLSELFKARPERTASEIQLLVSTLMRVRV